MTVKARRFRIGLAAATLAVATAASWIANSAHAGTLAVNVAFKGASSARCGSRYSTTSTRRIPTST